MEPLNEAAQVLTDEWQHKWNNPIESLPANGGMNTAEAAFLAKMTEAFERVAPPRANVEVEASSSEVDELKARLAKLEALIMAQAKASGEGRRV
jgi:hypothetical protein